MGGEKCCQFDDIDLIGEGAWGGMCLCILLHLEGEARPVSAMPVATLSMLVLLC